MIPECGITEQYTFDPQTGLLTNQTAIKNGSTTLLDLSYEYNRNGSVGSLSGKTGHLTRIIDNLNTNKNREYEFDALGRLGNGIRDTDENLKTKNPDYISNIYKAGTNIRAGTRYLQVLIGRAKGNIKAAYRLYRGRQNDTYHDKISKCAEQIKNGNYRAGLQVIYPGVA